MLSKQQSRRGREVGGGDFCIWSRGETAGMGWAERAEGTLALPSQALRQHFPGSARFILPTTQACRCRSDFIDKETEARALNHLAATLPRAVQQRSAPSEKVGRAKSEGFKCQVGGGVS